MEQAEKALSYGNVEVDEGNLLGVGCYGRVYKAKCGQLPCIAKIFHDVLFHFSPKEAKGHWRKLEKDCQFLSTIKHPHLLTYLGFVRDSKTRRLVLIMEDMDENLTHFLGRFDGPIPEGTQLKICRDLALGLSYLHSIGIVHRNISSNNILLVGECRAKVGDYGISSFADFNSVQSTASAYVPPEVLSTPPQCSEKTDVFSFGVLAIQIASRQPPNPAPTSKFMEYSTGKLCALVPEIERRKTDIDQMDPQHPLRPTALHCLRDKDAERPTANQLCEALAELTEKSKRVDEMKEELVKKGKSHSKEEYDDYTLEKFREKLTQLLHELNDRDEQIVHRDRDIRAMDAVLKRNAEELNLLEKKLEERAEVIKSLQKKVKVKTRDKSDSQHSQEQQEGKRSKQEADKPQQQRLKPKLYTKPQALTWMAGQSSPRAASTNTGCTATVDSNRVYISISYTIYSYTTITNKWIRLPECPQAHFGLAVVNEQVVAVGGARNRQGQDKATDTLMGLVANTKTWDEVLPPMLTGRVRPGTVATPTHLIVAGGRRDLDVGDEGITSIESLEVKNLQWSRVNCLPMPMPRPQLVITASLLLYVADLHSPLVYTCSVENLIDQTRLGDHRPKSIATSLPGDTPTDVPSLPNTTNAVNTVSPPPDTNTINTASLPDTNSCNTTSPCDTDSLFLSNNQPPVVKSPSMDNSTKKENGMVWKSICKVPSVGGATLVAIGNKVLALGGHDEKHEPSTTVAWYNATDDAWKTIGELNAPKWGVVAMSMPSGRILVVGGNLSETERCNSTDIGNLSAYVLS